MKICSRCKTEKDVTEYYKSTRNNDGLNYHCKECVARERSNRDAKNKEAISLWRKNWYQKNREKVLESCRIYNLKNPEKNREKARAAYWKDPERCKQRTARWIKEHPERVRSYYQGKTRPSTKTIKYRLNNSIRGSISKSITRGTKRNRRWGDLVGYNIDQLKRHLEKQFLEGMSWDNYGEWHIDHIVPISVFNFERPEDIDFKRCWSLKNLHPLWKTENLQKHNKIYKPFQPSLCVAV
jgi:hypothetical protein